ncbi:serine/threonine protein kinase [Streptomyces sp. NBC_01429]|uniref:serine/threonine protein kinase n=1 Tax=Streptomyces sp. NBC_01429 TaxID=2903862 RepID=UPI002E2CEB98|nr:serine/threonine protein kinase [Streptomyces sp. NBC_01429]
MDEYAGRVLADRYRLPLPPSDEYELAETRAFDTYSGQEVLVRQVPLPEVVEAEVIDADGAAAPRRAPGRTPRRHTDPAVRRAIEAAQSAAQIPDHPRLDQVFDVFAESGSLWIVSELVAARPLAALLAEKPLNPFRAAEIASDVLTAVRVVHAHGWTHRNITVRTVLVCDDGRVVLTGLAAGAAEEALCGYAPVPEPPDEPEPYEPGPPPPALDDSGAHEQLGTGGHPGPPAGTPEAGTPGLGYAPGPTAGVPGAQNRAALETGQAAQSPYGEGTSSGTSGAMPRPHHGTPGVPAPYGGQPALPGGSGSGDIRAARAGAIAAYRAGARAAARASEDRASDTGALPPLPEPGTGEEPRDPAYEARRDPERDETLTPPRGTSQGPSQGPSQGASPGPSQAGGDPDWWAQPRAFEETDADEDDDPPAPPYRARLAGVWNDGPAPWNDASGSLPAGGSPYGPDSAGPFGGGTSGIPVPGRRPAGTARRGRPALPPAGHDSAGHDSTENGATGATGAIEARGGGSPYSGSGNGPYGSGHTGGGQSGGGQSGGGHGGSGQFGSGQAGTGQAGGSRDALRADSQRHATQVPAAAGRGAGAGRWDEIVANGPVPAYRGPATPLAAERARQARIAVVGAVTERWAPEQAGPVHENWQLAPPIGPATDLWALGALLYRAVQGHAPYPEESAIELVQLVCAEPPAFAEECGPLRPVVESLLRQDPTERPDFEELRGWLRSLVRSAPEPEAGLDVVPVPSDETRLPIVRRRGELVRRRRIWGRGRDAEHGRHRHKKGKERKDAGGGRSAGGGEYVEQSYGRAEAEETYERPEIFESLGRPEPSSGSYGPSDPADRDDRAVGRSERGRAPNALGRTLLLLILLLLVAVVVYAVKFMPRTDTGQQGQSVGEASPGTSAAPQEPGVQPPGEGASDTGPSASGSRDNPNTSAPQTSGPAVDVAKGYALREDTEGFRIAVDKTWQRRPINDSGQVRYVGGDFTLIVVPGRDTVAQNGSDPMDYQRDKEREIQPFRDSSWATASGLRRIDVGQQAMAEGQYTWQDSSGRDVFVRNLAMIIAGRYHVIQVIGPEDERDKVGEIYEQATGAYRVTG